MPRPPPTCCRAVHCHRWRAAAVGFHGDGAAPAGDHPDARLPTATGVTAGRSIWTYPHTVLGMVGIFFYVGLEIALAAIAIQFCLSQGMTKVETASLMVSLFYLGMMAGRLLGSLIMVWIKAEKLLVLLGALGVVLLLTAMSTHGTVAIACLVLTGIVRILLCLHQGGAIWGEKKLLSDYL